MACSHDHVVELVDTRRRGRRARKGVGVRVSPWSLVCRRGRCPAGFHKARSPGSIPGPATLDAVGQGPVMSHKRRTPGAIPVPATVLTVCVRPVVQRLRRPAHIRGTMVRLHPGRLRRVRVRTCYFSPFFKGSSSNGTTPGLQPGDRGSTPRLSIHHRIAGPLSF
jgi:hypothetical protein